MSSDFILVIYCIWYASINVLVSIVVELELNSISRRLPLPQILLLRLPLAHEFS